MLKPRSNLAVGCTIIILLLAMAACEKPETETKSDSTLTEAGSMNNQDDYVEAIVIVADKKETGRIKNWFEDKGFQTIPMQAGLLITGTAGLFETTFNDTVGDRVTKQELSVPGQLEETVDHIVLYQVPKHTN